MWLEIGGGFKSLTVRLWENIIILPTFYKGELISGALPYPFLSHQSDVILHCLVVGACFALTGLANIKVAEPFFVYILVLRGRGPEEVAVRGVRGCTNNACKLSYIGYSPVSIAISFFFGL